MKRSVIIGLMSLLVSGSTWADQASVVVAGEGSVEVTPDIAFISIGVVSKSKEAKVARKRNAEESNKVTAILKDQFKVESKDIQTTLFDLSPEYRYEQNGKSTLLGFRVSHTLRVKVKNIEKIGEIVDKLAVSAPGQEEKMVSIQGVEFSSEKPEVHEQRSLENAMANAFNKAAVLAKAARRNLGSVIGVRESKAQSSEPMMMKGARFAMDAAMESSSNVQLGQIRVSANVVVEYELK